MQQIFRAHQLCDQDGPLGPYIDSYAAELRDKGYAQHTCELQVRVVADFGRWLASNLGDTWSRGDNDVVIPFPRVTGMWSLDGLIATTARNWGLNSPNSTTSEVSRTELTSAMPILLAESIRPVSSQ